jgi:hypothetical protein
VAAFARPDYYRVLQVDPAAHPEVVRAAYRTLLRVLGKHPDLGGSGGEATRIIEAYRTLGDPERRRAYDQWLAAHSAPPAPVSALAPGVATWIRIALPDYRLAPAAPFARSFDMVLEGPAPFGPRLYVKALPVVGRAQWPTIGVLCRAIGVARPGPLPSLDVVLLVGDRVDDQDLLLREARRHSARWGWHRLVIAFCALMPPGLHTSPMLVVPGLLRRLRAALPRPDGGSTAPVRGGAG